MADQKFQTTFPAIDECLMSLTSEDEDARPTSKEAFLRLSELVNNIPPVSLLIPGDVQNSWVKEFGHEFGWD